MTTAELQHLVIPLLESALRRDSPEVLRAVGCAVKEVLSQRYTELTKQAYLIDSLVAAYAPDMDWKRGFP